MKRNGDAHVSRLNVERIWRNVNVGKQFKATLSWSNDK